MPKKPLRPCLHPGCRTLTSTGYCDDHRPKYERGESAAWHRLYQLPEWKRGRAQYLASNPWCAECARQGQRVRATVVDHKQPHRGSIALFLNRSNWQGLCKRHHDAKTMAERRQRGDLVRARG